MRSLTIHDLTLGDSATFTKTVTDADIFAFAGISGDFNPVHVDAEFANNSRFGARVAHGPLTIALCAGIIGMELPGVGTIALDVETSFKLPVYVGDTITAHAEVAEIDVERNLVKIALAWTNQRGDTVAVGATRVKPPRESVLAPPTRSVT